MTASKIFLDQIRIKKKKISRTKIDFKNIFDNKTLILHRNEPIRSVPKQLLYIHVLNSLRLDINQKIILEIHRGQILIKKFFLKFFGANFDKKILLETR